MGETKGGGVMRGKNFNRLVISKMSRDAIPSGGGLADGIAFLSDPSKISEGAKAAIEWAAKAVEAVRCANRPNPFFMSDDEEIATHIMSKLNEMKGATR